MGSQSLVLGRHQNNIPPIIQGKCGVEAVEIHLAVLWVQCLEEADASAKLCILSNVAIWNGKIYIIQQQGNHLIDKAYPCSPLLTLLSLANVS